MRLTAIVAGFRARRATLSRLRDCREYSRDADDDPAYQLFHGGCCWWGENSAGYFFAAPSSVNNFRVVSETSAPATSGLSARTLRAHSTASSGCPCSLLIRASQ